ncbi:MAG: chalcone isomerase family protein [Gammaproteobacteria bacterium]
MRYIAVSLLTFGLISAVAAANLAGVEVPDTASVASTPLVLNGIGLRTKFFIKIYVGGLYIPQKSGDASAILAGTGPDRVLMHMIYAVSKDQFSDAWTDGFKDNDAQDYTALQDPIQQFIAAFGDSKKDDVITLDYVPGVGTQVLWNGTLRATIAGEAFHRALLNVFLGPKPPTSDLKDGMLGKS